ncbi:MAG: plasmid pRiA4b ORF-3 family protein [Lentisphaerae bacterium]|jgi:hypothetical protein|nr:plasmid pRiA4b ORF-3 family protein [Lentisphaerota bacterium]
MRPVYQLTISLLESNPRIWRQVLVSGNVRLKKLHKIIQAVMPWTDSHLHQFIFPDTIYSDPTFEIGEEMDLEVRNEANALLRKVATSYGCVFVYQYDFGDDWRHLVQVDYIADNHPSYPGHPVCLGGEFACPPEDCGGIVGYYHEFLPAFLDPEHQEGPSTRAWAGEDFDPEVFELDAANQRLRELK